MKIKKIKHKIHILFSKFRIKEACHLEDIVNLSLHKKKYFYLFFFYVVSYAEAQKRFHGCHSTAKKSVCPQYLSGFPPNVEL